MSPPDRPLRPGAGRPGAGHPNPIRPPGRLRSAIGRWTIRLFRAGVTLGFFGFAAFLALQLRESFARRSADRTSAPARVPEEPEEMVSRAIELTQFDDRGRPLVEITAEEALGRTDDRQRFSGVEVRVFEIHDGSDAVVAADELLLGTDGEALEFLGNALLKTPGLELSGPRLQFRRAPDRLWSSDPVQFRTDDFVGIAASLQYRIDSGEVSLRGVVAGPVEAEGLSVVAERARFDRTTQDTRLFGGIEIASKRLALTSVESVVLRRDRERGLMRSLEAGFGTVLRVLPEPRRTADSDSGDSDAGDPDAGGAGAGPVAPPRESGEAAGPQAGVSLHGDEVEIELDGGRNPRTVRVPGNPFVTSDGRELRAEQAWLDLGEDGLPERLRLRGEVTSSLPAGPDGESRIAVEADEMVIGFDGQGQLAEAQYRGAVAARHGGASASADAADWDGRDTLVLRGSPRVVDSSLVELEGGDLRLIVGEESRLEAREAVTARFLPNRLDWLPGRFEEVGLTSDAASLESGSGRGAFRGGVRLLFGRNRLVAETLEVDARSRTLHAEGGVGSTLEIEVPPPAEPGEVTGPPAPADSGGEADGGSRSPPEGETFAFDARAERFSFLAAESRLSWEGAPRLEQRSAAGGVSRVSAGRIEAELRDGSLAAIVGEHGARFERGVNEVKGARIRYEPGPDRLEAWGFPAAIAVEGRLSEGGHLEVGFRDDRSEIHPTRAGRALARVKVRNPGR